MMNQTQATNDPNQPPVSLQTTNNAQPTATNAQAPTAPA